MIIVEKKKDPAAGDTYNYRARSLKALLEVLKLLIHLEHAERVRNCGRSSACPGCRQMALHSLA
jgi:hypothetical protein